MPDENGKKKSLKAPITNRNTDFDAKILKSKAELPKGAVYAGKDENGQDIWEVRTKNEAKSVSKDKPKNNKPSTNKSGLRPPRPKKEETFGETIEKFTIPPPEVVPPKQTNLYGEVQTYAKALDKNSANQDWIDYEFASPSGNTTNEAVKASFDNSGKHFTFDKDYNRVYSGKTIDDFRNKSIQQIETPQMSGVNKPNLIDNNTFSQKGTVFTKNASGGLGVNKTTLGANLKGATDTYVPKKYDALGKEIITDSGLKPLGTSVEGKKVGEMYPVEIKEKFAKDGIVQKLWRGGKVKGDKNGDGYVDAAEQQSLDNQDKAKYNEAIRGLGQGVMVAGDAMNEKPTDIYADPKKDAAEKAVNDGVVAGASSKNPWTALMVGASNIGKSGLEKDKYGDLEGGANQAAGEAMTAAPFAYSESAKKEGLGAVARDVFLGGQYIRAVSSGLGQGEKTSGFVGGINKFSGLTKRNEIRDKPFSQQKKEAAELSIKTRQEQAILNRNNNEENAKIIDPYAVSENPQYDKDKRLILNDGSIYQGKPMNKGGVVGKVKQMCAKGGVIEGEGGPKDDKINAKVKPGSFVVPAENTKVAETLREKLLMKAPKMKADLNQKGGIGVMLSNKEHLFTPEEKEELLRKGVNVDLLAPKSEVKAVEKKSHVIFPNVIGMATGGDVVEEDTVDPIKELARLNKEKEDAVKAGKVESDAAKAARDKRIADFNANVASYDRKADRKNKVSEWEKKRNDSKTKLEALNKSYEDASKSFEAANTPTAAQKAKGIKAGALNDTQRKYKEDLLKKIQEAQSEHDNAKRTYDYVKSGKTYVAPKAETKTPAPKAETKAPAPKVETKTATTEVKPTTTAPVKTGLKAPKISSKTDAGKFVAPVVVDNGEEVIVPGGNLSPNELAAKKATEDKAASDATVLNNSLPQTVTDQGLPKSKSNGILSKLGNIDPTAFVGIGQTAMGLNMLKDEKRPVDKAVIDPTYNANVNRSINDAKFGLSPEQRFAAEQDIQNSLNDARFAARSKGFSASDTLNQERASINDAWRNKLGLKTADTEMRMNKQMYADQQVANRANILAGNRRRSFEDAMSTFQQKQQAGSELIGAGLANTIGAYRFNKDLEAQKEANLASNAWTRQYGQTNV